MTKESNLLTFKQKGEGLWFCFVIQKSYLVFLRYQPKIVWKIIVKCSLKSKIACYLRSASWFLILCGVCLWWNMLINVLRFPYFFLKIMTCSKSRIWKLLTNILFLCMWAFVFCYTAVFLLWFCVPFILYVFPLVLVYNSHLLFFFSIDLCFWIPFWTPATAAFIQNI